MWEASGGESHPSRQPSGDSNKLVLSKVLGKDAD